MIAGRTSRPRLRFSISPPHPAPHEPLAGNAGPHGPDREDHLAQPAACAAQVFPSLGWVQWCRFPGRIGITPSGLTPMGECAFVHVGATYAAMWITASTPSAAKSRAR